MGQYWCGHLVPDSGKKQYIVDTDLWQSGMKMKEHYGIHSMPIKAAFAIIDENPCRVGWIGDYGNEDSDFEIAPKWYGNDVYEACWSGDEENRRGMVYGKEALPISDDWNPSSGYLVNHDKRCFIDLDVARHTCLDGYGRSISPLPLLCAIGNGRGGGDYDGMNLELVGSWAYDLIERSDEAPSGYVDATSIYRFGEVG